MIRIMITVLLVALALSTVGCDDFNMAEALGIVEEAKVQVEAQQETLLFMQQQLAELDQLLLTMEPGSEKERTQAVRDGLAIGVAKAAEILAGATTVLADAEEALSDAEEVADLIQPAARTIAGFLPPPWNILVTAGAGLGVSVWQSLKHIKAKRGARQIVTAFERAKVPGSDTINLAAVKMSGTGKDLVDKIQATMKT